MEHPEIRAVVATVLDEQRDQAEAIAEKVVVRVLKSFGIHEGEREQEEMRLDFAHLRRWRKSVEQAGNYTVSAIIMTLITGVAALGWMGIRGFFGK